MSTEAAEPSEAGHLTGFGSTGYRNYVLLLLMGVYTLNFIDRTLIAVVAQPIIELFGGSVPEEWGGNLPQGHMINLNAGFNFNENISLSVNAQNAFDDEVMQHVFGDIISRKVSGQLLLRF